MTLALGLMSGTSCDGITAALADFHGPSCRILAHHTYPYPASVASRLRQAQAARTPEIARLNVLLGERFAAAARDLLRRSRVAAGRVAVLGSHGHTVYHGPDDPVPCTLQIGEPAIIAQRTGIPVVADFRQRDLAAGGQGAPLVPAFDAEFFGRGRCRALQNIGGIANVAVVGRGVRPLAFDTGPGNCWMDALARRISRGRLQFDRAGRLAKSGRVNDEAVRRLWAHPYFRLPPPKSTGPEVFHERALRQLLGRTLWGRPADALATVTFFTAFSVAESYRRFISMPPREVIVSGGGVRNRTLMTHLIALLAPVPVCSIERYGIPSQAKEPVAFAYLALRAQRGQGNHLPATTGATEACVLGTLTPA